jgi:hypothetical protein
VEVQCLGCLATAPYAAASCPKCGRDLIGVPVAIVEADSLERSTTAESEAGTTLTEVSSTAPPEAIPRVGPRSPLTSLRGVVDSSLVMQRQLLIPPAVAADQLRSWRSTSAGIRLRRATLLPDDSKDLTDGCLWRARLQPRGPAVHGTECELGLLAWAPWRSAMYLRRLQTPLSWAAWFRFGHSVLDEVVAHLVPVSPQNTRCWARYN